MEERRDSVVGKYFHHVNWAAAVSSMFPDEGKPFRASRDPHDPQDPSQCPRAR
jgi:hypothetical protein